MECGLKRLKSLGLAAALLLGSACVSKIPREQYAIAHSAVRSAQSAGAPRFAPGLWYEAERNYRRAEKLYRERHFVEAERLFLDATRLAEKAENTARVKQLQTGEFAP